MVVDLLADVEGMCGFGHPNGLDRRSVGHKRVGWTGGGNAFADGPRRPMAVECRRLGAEVNLDHFAAPRDHPQEISCICLYERQSIA
jgi:hypothetical protein